MNKKLAFCGFYGFGNYGDELFAAICCLGAQRYWSGLRVSVVAPPGPHLDNAHVELPSVLPASLYSGLGPLGQACRLAVMAKSLIKNNRLVLGGGSVFSSQNLTGVRRLQEWASRLGLTSLSGIGVSIGPFSSNMDKQRCADFLRRFEYVSVRDKSSYEQLCAMSMPFEPVLARDLAGTLPRLLTRQPVTQFHSPLLGIAPCNYGPGAGWQVNVLAEAISDSVHRTNASVRVFVLNEHTVLGDGTLATSLVDNLKAASIKVDIVRVSDGVLNMWDRISECNWMFSVRLHSAITAYMCNVPFVLAEYHQKCTEFNSDVGVPELLRLKMDNINWDTLSAAIQELDGGFTSCSFPRESYADEALLNFTAAPWAACSV